MLILSRKQTESFHINDNIVVTVLSIRGRCVRLGIVAPRNVSVYCDEVHAAISRLRPRFPSCGPPLPAPSMTAPSVMVKQAAKLLSVTTARPVAGVKRGSAGPSILEGEFS